MAATVFSSNDHTVKVFLEEETKDDFAKKEKPSQNIELVKATETMKTKSDAEDDDEEEREMKEMGERECEEEERPSWSNKREYVLTVMGLMVGAGNIFRFPYMCNRNGGGAYLLPFLLCLVVMGFPLFFLETALGQFNGKSPLHVWSICPLVRGVGIAMCLLSLINFWYFTTIMSWALYFMVSSFRAVVPWSQCGQWWNTPQCLDLSRRRNATSDNVTSGWEFSTAPPLNGSRDVFGNSTGPLKAKLVTAAEEFWQYNVLQVSGGFYEPGHVVWYLAVMQCVVILLIFLALLKGVKSTGKVVYVTATAPYVLLTILLVRGITLPGAVDGILFYITPDFDRLLDPQVWLEAAIQVFYSLGPVWGGLIALASYNRFDNNCLRDSFLLTLLGEGTSVYGGFAIFSVLGYMGHQTGLPIREVVSSGPGLAFIAYPEAISLMPLPQLWAVLFFFMILTLIFDTQLTGGETVLTVLCDSYPKLLGRHRASLTGCFCVVCLLTSLILVSQGGIYVFQLFDWFLTTITMTTVGLIECVVIGWVYGANRFGQDIHMMLGRKPPMIINILWCFIDPSLMALLLVMTLAKYQPPTYRDYRYDSVSTALGWGIALTSFIPIPIMAVHQLMKAKGSLAQRLRQTTTPDKNWGPADPSRRLLYRKEMLQRTSRRHCLDVFR